MSANPHRPAWSSTYRVSSESRQQRILRVIHRLDRPDTAALGTTCDSQTYVVIECASAAAEMRARRIVFTLHLMAERTETTRAPVGLHEAPVPTTAYRAGLTVPRRLRD